MEKQVFNPEQLERTITLLKQYGVAQRGKDVKASQRHNLAYLTLGKYAAEEIPDSSPIANSADVGKAVVYLLGTLPGIDTKGIIEETSKPNSIAISDRAIRVDLRREGKNRVEMYLTFPSAFPIPYDEYFTLQFDRTDDKTCLSLKIKMDSSCFPRSGEITVYDVDQNFRTPRSSAEFRQDSVVIEASSKMNLTKGEGLDIIKLTSEITTSNNLDSPLNPNLIIQRAKIPQLPTPTQ